MTERKGALFSIGKNSDVDREKFLSLVSLSQQSKDLVLAMFQVCQESDDGLADVYDICAQLAIQPPAIRKRAILLEQQGVIVTGDFRIPGNRRPSKIYTLQDADKLPSQNELESNAMQSFQFPLHLDGHSLEITLSDQPRIDEIFCSVFFGALRYSKRDRRHKITTELRWGRESIPVETTALQDTGMAFISDIRFAVAVLTICEQIMRDRQRRSLEVRNRFIVSVSDMLAMIGLAPEGGNRQTAVGALQRLEATRIKILEMPESFRSRFGPYFFGTQNFQLITELGVYGTEHTEGRIPDQFVLSLSEAVFHRVRNESVYALFSVSPDLLRETNPTAMAFTLWARRAIGYGDRGTMWWPARSLQQGVSPQSPFKDFMKAFHRLLESRQMPLEEAPDGEEAEMADVPRSRINGYIIRPYKDRFEIYPDPTDPYVGANAAYNRLSQKGPKGVRRALGMKAKKA